jgi:protein-S-isoprenylcysteine O-methyltransferase Ste14
MRIQFSGFGITAYAGLAYASFTVSSLWAAGFLAGAGAPTTVDGPTIADGTARLPAGAALAVDAGLLLVFAAQHSVMARAGFKARLARVLPAAAERSTYVLATSAALLLLLWQWQPVPASVWHLAEPPWAGLVWALYAAGWLVALGSTFMVDHLDFLGLRQARRHAAGTPYAGPPFTERWLYAWVRHPMMLGLLITFWATPAMTAGHLFFALAAAGYIAVGLRFEERDLIRNLGRDYCDYAERVPALIPRITK